MKHLFLLLLLLPLMLEAQDQAELDSLNGLLESVEHDTARAKLLDKIGTNYYHKSEYKIALDYKTRSLNIYEELGEKKGVAWTAGYIGVIYTQQGNYDQALDYYSRSLNIYEELGDNYGIASTLAYLAAIYGRQGNTEQALDYYSRSLKIHEETGNKKGIAVSLGNIGTCYYYQGNYDQALDYYLKSIKIYERLGNIKILPISIAGTLNNIGFIYKDQGNYEQALDYFSKSLKICEEAGNNYGIAVSLGNIGDVYCKQNNTEKAISIGEKGLRLALEVGVVATIRDNSTFLFETYQKSGNYKKALEMHQLHIEMRDSIENIEVQKKSLKLKMKLDEQANQHAISQKEQELKSEKKIRNLLLGGVGVISLLLIFAINRFLVTRKQKDTITEQKKVVEEQKELVEEQKKDITDSIRYAENIQRALLPTHHSIQALLPDSFILFKPKDVVSGDFYWMQHHNEQVYLAACDCTGHGVPGAFMSMIGSSQLDEAVVEKGITQPNEIFYEVRKGFINALKQTAEAGQQKDGMDASLIAWDKKNKLQYATANNPIFLIRKGELLETKPDRQPVGFHLDNSQPFTHHELQLEKEDVIYLFSDGYPDQFGGPKQKKFMMKSFKNLLLSIHQEPMETQRAILEAKLKEWRGNTEQIDDILVMGIRF